MRKISVDTVKGDQGHHIRGSMWQAMTAMDLSTRWSSHRFRMYDKIHRC